MRQRAQVELVAQYVDSFSAGLDNPEAYLKVFPQFRREVEPLFEVARQVKIALAPVEPSAEFSHRLRSRLIVAWQAEKAQRESRRGWWIRAAVAGSVVSMAALAAVFARSRGQCVAIPAIKLR